MIRQGLFDTEIGRIVEAQRLRARTRQEGGWVLVASDDQGEAWDNITLGLRVLWSVDREKDGRPWLHASMSHRERIPTWDELKYLKSWLVPDDRYAYQVLPPASRYVNANPNVLHLWAVVAGPEPVPDFLRDNGEI